MISGKKGRLSRQCLFLFSLSLSLSSLAFAAPTETTVNDQLAKLEASTGGRLGISAWDTGTNKRIEYRARERFPMGCVSKVMGVAALLKKSSEDHQLLQTQVKYSQKDLDEWAPITKDHVANGMTVAEMAEAAISYSDNTAMNLVAQKIGGIQGINDFAHSIGDYSFKLDHSWPEEAMSDPYGFEDSTTPAAMENSFEKIILGSALDKPQQTTLQDWMKKTITGPNRIKAGIPNSWIIGHKTGTGFNYGTVTDLAIVWPANCSPLLIGVYYTNLNKEAPKREDILASATRVIINSFTKTNACLKV